MAGVAKLLSSMLMAQMTINQIFNVNWEDHKELFQKNHFLRISNALNEDFRINALKLFEEGDKHSVRSSTRVRYEIPNLLAKEFKDMIHTLTDTPRQDIVISEQHFLKHNYNHHPLHFDQVWEEFALLLILDFPKENDTRLKIYNNSLFMPIKTGQLKREWLFYKNYQRIYNSIATEIPAEVGDIVFFRSSSLAHQRTNPEGIIHYRLAANSLGLSHPDNATLNMMQDTYPYGPPQKMPTWFESQFEDANPEDNILYNQKELFQSFWDNGSPTSHKIKEWVKSQSRRVLRKLLAPQHR